MVHPVTTYDFNIYGQQTSITDANGRVTKFTFNEYGQQLSRTLPDDGNWATNETESMAYNQFGDLDYSLDFNGTKADRVYDYELTNSTKFGRLMQTTWTASGASTPGVTVNYTFDSRGRSDQVIEIEGGVTRVTDTDYDSEGRVSKITRPEGWLTYGYDSLTDQHISTKTANSEWSYGHDWLGRLVSVADVSAGITTVTSYDVLGNVVQVQSKQGAATLKTTTYEHDSIRHWLVGVENKDSAGNAVSSFDYTRRDDGQITKVEESVKQPDGSFESVTAKYTYDAINRLTKEVVDSSVSGKDYTNEYFLDRVGNRTKLVETKGTESVTTTYTYNARDQLLTGANGSTTIEYGYDSNGSLTSQTGRTQTWDLRGRLSGASVGSTTTSYRYTPDGIRSSVTEGNATIDYIIDGMTPSGYQQVVEETSGGVLAVRYTYGASLDPISETRSGTSSLYLGDGHSGVRQALSLAGAVVLAQRFDAFGVSMRHDGLATPVGYRGERFDATLGQYYLRARYYDPRNGRFTGVDPFAGNMGDPLQLMRYGYAGSNSLMMSDPSGRWSALGVAAAITIGFAVGGAAIGGGYGFYNSGWKLQGLKDGAIHGAGTGLAIGGSLAVGFLGAYLLAPYLLSASAAFGYNASAIMFGLTGSVSATAVSAGVISAGTFAMSLLATWGIGALGTQVLGTYLPIALVFAFKEYDLSAHLWSVLRDPRRNHNQTYIIPDKYNERIASASEIKRLIAGIRSNTAPSVGTFRIQEIEGTINKDVHAAFHDIDYKTIMINGKLHLKIIDKYDFEYQTKYYYNGEGSLATNGANVVALSDALGLFNPLYIETNWIPVE